VSDRIALTVSAPEDVLDAARAHLAFLAGETLADSVTYGPADGGFEGTVGDGIAVRVSVSVSTG